MLLFIYPDRDEAIKTLGFLAFMSATYKAYSK